MTITEFLTARCDEDEERASSGWSSLRDERWMTTNEGRSILTPSAVLADIAAKRAIVAAHPMEYLDAWGTSVCTTCTSDLNPTWTEGGGPCTTLRLLAQPYAEHPDYGPAWRTA